MKKYKIEVIVKGRIGIPQTSLGKIKRSLHAEEIGNFNPIFCTFQGTKHLVKSREGDLSDPFRHDESYLNSLYIEI
jgi:hypothetical protein